MGLFNLVGGLAAGAVVQAADRAVRGELRVVPPTP